MENGRGGKSCPELRSATFIAEALDERLFHNLGAIGMLQARNSGTESVSLSEIFKLKRLLAFDL